VFAILTPFISHVASTRVRSLHAWHRVYVVLCVCLLAVLAGCSSTSSGKAEAGFYRVQAGDTLSQIARQHNTSVAELMRLNNLSNANRISKGQLLRVNASGASVPPSSTSSRPSVTQRRTY